MAAIVQKTSATTTATTSTLFFGCGDIFNLNNSNADKVSAHSEQQQQQQHQNAMKHTPTSSLSSSPIAECRDGVMMDTQDKFENLKENGNCTATFPRFHNALTRTISQPQTPLSLQAHQGGGGSGNGNMNGAATVSSTLVTPLIEDFGNINLHRKLERTQSEPLPQQQVNTSRYKTELCRPFEEAGECKYGEKCQFAHGYHELRNLQRHPKYKTEYCRTFHSVGFCPYGPRCHFVHNVDEVRSSQQQLPQQQPQQQQQKQHSVHHTSANNFNNCLTTFGLSATVAATIGHQQQQQQQPNGINLGLPLSPPLSMSTGSDRESPTGSLSLSPANSMTNFPFGDQIIINQTNHPTSAAGNNTNSVFQTNSNYAPSSSSYVNTPPESPNAPISPVSTPPPHTAAAAMQMQYIKPTAAAANIVNGKLLLQKSSSSPIAAVGAAAIGSGVLGVGVAAGGVNKSLYKMNSASSLNGGGDGETRLPVFNRLSSTTEHSPNMAL